MIFRREPLKLLSMNDQRERFVEIGARIAAARRGAGLTQGALAGHLGLPLGIVDKFEVGRADPMDHIEAVAEATGRSAKWLTTGAEASETEGSMLDALGELITQARQDPAVDEFEPGATDSTGEPSEALPHADATSVDDEAAEPDELDKILASLAHQRDDLRRRELEADRRGRELDSQALDLDEFRRVLRESREEFEREWIERLREFEELQRQAIELAATLADRAAALRHELARDAPETVQSVHEGSTG